MNATATAEPQAEEAVKTTEFLARCENLCLTVEPADRTINFNGQTVTSSPGKRIQFENHLFNATPEETEFLRGHRNFNGQNHNGFWDSAAPPDAPRPLLTDQLNAVATAAAGRDAEALLEVARVEQDTHKRPEVLSAIEAATVALERAWAESEDREAAEQARINDAVAKALAARDTEQKIAEAPTTESAGENSTPPEPDPSHLNGTQPSEVKEDGRGDVADPPESIEPTETGEQPPTG